MKKSQVSESMVFGQSVIEKKQVKNARVARYDSYREFLSSSDFVDLSKKLKPLAKSVHATLHEELPYLGHLFKKSLSLFKLEELLFEAVVYGDWFGEVISDPENSHLGPLLVQALPSKTVFRIETTKGKVVEFQQSYEGPDLSVISKPINEPSTTVRFSPEQIIHVRVDCGKYYPYGTSRLEQSPFKNTPFVLDEPSLDGLEEQIVESIISVLGV